jgi:hypothetical protein
VIFGCFLKILEKLFFFSYECARGSWQSIAILIVRIGWVYKIKIRFHKTKKKSFPPIKTFASLKIIEWYKYIKDAPFKDEGFTENHDAIGFIFREKIPKNWFFVKNFWFFQKFQNWK